MTTAKRITPDPVPDTIQITLTEEEAQFLATLLIHYDWRSAYHGPTAENICASLTRYTTHDYYVSPTIQSNLITFDKED